VVRHAVVLAGGIPRFVDIDLENFSYNLDDLHKNICRNTRAIVIVHYFGRPACNLQDVLKIAREKDIRVVEDCAHSLGAEWEGRKVGSFGDFSIFSLTKGMINFGGGVLVTGDEKIYQKARQLLDEEKSSLKDRILDFPLILAYGLEQMIEKSIFDRVKKSIFKWWLLSLPMGILAVRDLVIRALKSPLSLISGRKKTNAESGLQEANLQPEGYPQGVGMEPIIASLARSQLRKLESLIEQRRKVYSELHRIPNCHLKRNSEFHGRDVDTQLLFRFQDRDTNEVIEHCKSRGLLLRGTWPTHQRLWKGQDTRNVRTLEREFLIWNVNPDLNEREKATFIEILEDSVKPPR
jgi:dTDP-4-amino-4,6-dideoxygalactose transaminase